jgi:hypothetical protein
LQEPERLEEKLSPAPIEELPDGAVTASIGRASFPRDGDIGLLIDKTAMVPMRNRHYQDCSWSMTIPRSAWS